MHFVRSIWILVVVAGGSLPLACGPVHSVTVGRDDREQPEVHESAGHGPPPHAPAHGYRRKHQHAYHQHAGEVELIFDSGLGVYVVVGLPNHYYWNGSYLRIQGSLWSTSAYLDGAWKPYSERSLPAGLRAKHAKAKKSSGKGKGQGPAKRHP